MMCKNDRLNYLKALAALCMTVPLFLIYSYLHYDAVQPGKIIYSSFRERSAAGTNRLAEGKMEIVHPKNSYQTANSRSAERPDLQNRSVTTNRPHSMATNNPHFATTSRSYSVTTIKTVSSETHKPHKVELPIGSEPVVTMASAQHIALEAKDLTRSKYPDWWLAAYSRSATFGVRDQFVGDRPLLPACVESPNRRDFYPRVQPKRYMSRTKNPCWMETRGDSTRELYCIPYFYVAGVAKCGTTDIYRRVRQHPDVMRGTMKEYHWWDRGRFEDTTETGDRISFKEYSMKVTGKAGIEAVFKDLRMNGTSVKIFGDGSPSYFWDIHNWPFLDGNQGCLEPRVVIGQHILHVYPNVKMILTFRHPRTRLYSRFLSRLNRPVEQLKGATVITFHELVVRATRLYRQCFEKWSVRHCAYNLTLFDEAVTRLMEGMYSVFMADWLRIFPRNQMHIIRSEDYAKDLEGEIKKMFTFLGLAPLSAEEMAPIVKHPKINVGSMYEKLGPMLPETAAILDEFYQPFMTKLAEILGDERFLWKDVQLP